MRLIRPFAIAALLLPTLASVLGAQPSRPPQRAVGSMAELMSRIIYPTSDAILYVSSRSPENETDWNELEAKALTLAESANLIMMPWHARDRGQWMEDSKLMLDAGIAAWEAAKARDLDALIDLNQQVYDSCVVCHLHYRPDYGDRARELEAESEAAGARTDAPPD